MLVVRVHPQFLDAQRLPPPMLGEELWPRRFRQINDNYGHNFGDRILTLAAERLRTAWDLP